MEGCWLVIEGNEVIHIPCPLGRLCWNPVPSTQISVAGKTKAFCKSGQKLTTEEKKILDVDTGTKTRSCCKLCPSFSLQAIALKIAQEISPPVPQPIFHLHGGKDFL